MTPLWSMRGRGARALPVTLVLTALAALLVPAVAAAQSAEERRLSEASSRLEELSAEIERAEQEAEEAEAELEDADERLREVEAVVNEVANAVERQQGAVQEAEERLERVEAEAAEVAEAFGERASRMYKQGASASFQVLLDSGTAADAFDRSAYLRQVTNADQASIERLEASRTAVEAERERLAEERERLEEMLAEQEELLAEVQELRESRALAAAAARDEVELLEERHDDLEGDQRAIEQTIRERQGQSREQGSAGSVGTADVGGSSSAGYAWPLCAPVTSEYGRRWGRLHAGIDQGASTGTPVGASKGGRVISAGRQGGYGNMVLIDHGDGVVTGYAHLSRISVSGGQSVSQGTTIGAVGNTGNSTGPHLHFETRVNGSAVNPRQYLSGGPC